MFASISSIGTRSRARGRGSIPYAERSWAIFEGSREVAGIPAVFLLKTAIPLFAALLILQGIADAVRAAARLRGRIGVDG